MKDQESSIFLATNSLSIAKTIAGGSIYIYMHKSQICTHTHQIRTWLPFRVTSVDVLLLKSLDQIIFISSSCVYTGFKNLPKIFSQIELNNFCNFPARTRLASVRLESEFTHVLHSISRSAQQNPYYYRPPTYYNLTTHPDVTQIFSLVYALRNVWNVFKWWRGCQVSRCCYWTTKTRTQSLGSQH